jgi:hypothetical protein
LKRPVPLAASAPCRTDASRTFLLVMTVYAAAVAKPGHGNTAPLAIGLSLYAAALTGEHPPCGQGMGGPLLL